MAATTRAIHAEKSAATCHDQAKTWDCTSCHGYPPTTGRHRTHVEVFGVPCEVCHADHLHTYRAAIRPLDRVGAVDVALLFLRGTYDSATQTCIDVGCHLTRKWED